MKSSNACGSHVLKVGDCRNAARAIFLRSAIQHHWRDGI
jgi:hypothetical protein